MIEMLGGRPHWIRGGMGERETGDSTIIYIKAIWVIDQVGLQVGLRALNGRGRMNSMWKSQLKP